VPEVVRAELELEAVGRPAARSAHHPGVVDQQVEAVMRIPEALGKTAHGIQAREVELLELNLGVRDRGPNLIYRGVSLVEIAAGQHHACAGASQLPRRN
jgi:hypothetical protein